MSAKPILTTLIIFSFAATAVFGMFAMNYTASSHCYGRCIEAIKIFSTSALSLLVILIIIALAPIVLPIFEKTSSCRKIFESYPCELKFIHWLAMRENSPDVI